MFEGDIQVAKDYLLQALDIFPKDTEFGLHVPTMWYLTHVSQYRGDYDEASKRVEDLRDLSERIYKPYLVVANLEQLFLNIVYGDIAGDYSSAYESLDYILKNTAIMFDHVRSTEATVYQGMLALRQHNVDQAQSYAEQALSRCHDGNMLSVKAKALALIGQVELLKGNINRARNFIQQSENTPRNFAGFREVDYGWMLLHLINGEYKKAGQSLTTYVQKNRTNAIRYTKKFGEAVYYTIGFLPMLAAIEYGLGNTNRAQCLYMRYQHNKPDHQAWVETLPILQVLESILKTDDPNIIEQAESLDLLTLVPDILESYTQNSDI